jgi:hypothetical protein
MSVSIWNSSCIHSSFSVAARRSQVSPSVGMTMGWAALAAGSARAAAMSAAAVLVRSGRG